MYKVHKDKKTFFWNVFVYYFGTPLCLVIIYTILFCFCQVFEVSIWKTITLILKRVTKETWIILVYIGKEQAHGCAAIKVKFEQGCS